MGYEFCSLHPYQKIRNGSKLNTIHILSNVLCFLKSGAVKK